MLLPRARLRAPFGTASSRGRLAPSGARLARAARAAAAPAARLPRRPGLQLVEESPRLRPAPIVPLHVLTFPRSVAPLLRGRVVVEWSTFHHGSSGTCRACGRSGCIVVCVAHPPTRPWGPSLLRGSSRSNCQCGVHNPHRDERTTAPLGFAAGLAPVTAPAW